MILRGLKRAFMIGLSFAWLVLMALQTAPKVNHHEHTQTRSARQSRTNKTIFYGPIYRKMKHKVEKHVEPLSSRGGGAPGIRLGPPMEFVATWYDGANDGINGSGLGLTSTGTVPRAGVTVAVDPSVIAYGSEIEVELADGTVQYLHAEDTGGAIRGNRIDIFNPSRSQCLKFGRENVVVRLISK